MQLPAQSRNTDAWMQEMTNAIAAITTEITKENDKLAGKPQMPRPLTDEIYKAELPEKYR